MRKNQNIVGVIETTRGEKKYLKYLEDERFKVSLSFFQWISIIELNTQLRCSMQHVIDCIF